MIIKEVTTLSKNSLEKTSITTEKELTTTLTITLITTTEIVLIVTIITLTSKRELIITLIITIIVTHQAIIMDKSNHIPTMVDKSSIMELENLKSSSIRQIINPTITSRIALNLKSNTLLEAKRLH